LKIRGRLPDNTEVKWVISGEFVELSRDNQGRTNCISAKVEEIMQLGDISSITFSLDLPFSEMMHLELSTRMVKDFQLLKNDRLFISLDPAGIHIMPVYSDPNVKMLQKLKREKKIQIGAILLVAGQGTRLGSIPKSLMKIDGKTLLNRHLEAIGRFVTTPVVIVTGYYEQQIRSSIYLPDVHLVTNSDPARGQSSSVRIGLETIYQQTKDLDVVLMVLGDQPYLDESDLRQLIEQFKVMPSGDFLLPMVNGQRGNPVLLSGKALQEIINCNEKMTVRDFMDLHPHRVTQWASNNHHFTFDIDSEEDMMDFQSKTGMYIELPYQDPQ
jgi:molybdenum cofactor cytidylyltransferase